MIFVNNSPLGEKIGPTHSLFSPKKEMVLKKNPMKNNLILHSPTIMQKIVVTLGKTSG